MKNKPAYNDLLILVKELKKELSKSKKIEDKLRISEGRLQQVTLVSEIGIFDHNHLNDSTWCSPKLCELHNWDTDKSYKISDFIDLAHPDDRDKAVKIAENSLDHRGNGKLKESFRILRSDGSIRWLNLRLKTFFKENGTGRQAVRTVGAVIDETRQKLAEEALLLKNRTIETSLNGIIIMNAKWKLIYTNPAFLKLWGYTSEAEIHGKMLAEFLEHEHTFQIIDHILRNGTYIGELSAQRRDGTDFDVMISANSILNTHGEIVNYVASFIDTSELKQLQSKMLYAQRMESASHLACGVAHDFNNVLTIIKGYVDIAQMSVNSNDPLYKNLTKIRKAADSAAELSQQLLAFSRKQIIRPKMLNLNDVIMNIEPMLISLIGEDIELQTSLLPELGNIKFDRSQIEQILINLSINAKDAMREGGRLIIETTNTSLDDTCTSNHIDARPGEKIVLTISDTGSGLSEDAKSHLFEPFFTTKEYGHGTGLGLAMVNGAVSQNGGWIDVHSELEQGTTFKIYLPRVYKNGLDEINETNIALLPGTGTIVLAEDNEGVRFFTSFILKRQGYTVFDFPDGLSAIQAVCGMDESPHLLIIDVVLPDMNGHVLAQRILEIKPAVKILFTSGYSDNIVIRHGILPDDMAFIQKPYSVETLLQNVQKVLNTPIN